MKYLRIYPQWGNTTRCYEDFDFDEDDFDFEEDGPYEIIGNKHFTDFLLDRDLYDKFLESAYNCNQDRQNNWTIETINKKIISKGIYDIFNQIIAWSCASRYYGIRWGNINRDWNRLCIDNPQYNSLNENFDWNDDDFDEEEFDENEINNKYFKKSIIQISSYANYNKIMKIMDKFDIKWMSNNKASKLDLYDNHPFFRVSIQEMNGKLKMSYGDIETYRTEYYKKNYKFLKDTDVIEQFQI